MLREPQPYRYPRLLQVKAPACITDFQVPLPGSLRQFHLNGVNTAVFGGIAEAYWKREGAKEISGGGAVEVFYFP